MFADRMIDVGAVERLSLTGKIERERQHDLLTRSTECLAMVGGFPKFHTRLHRGYSICMVEL